MQSDRLLQSDAQAARRQLEVKLTRLQENRTDRERYLQVGLGRDMLLAVSGCKGWNPGLDFCSHLLQEHELRMLEYEREEEALMIAITRLQRQLTTQV